MHCPECNVLLENDAVACRTCGLIIPDSARPKRRQEDLSGQNRRAVDSGRIPCPFCGGQIESGSLRCKHCGDIVDDSYRRARARKLRSRINYASWVAYFFGLFAFLIFKPVGLISIAAGLILSIVYYAIPVDGDSKSDKDDPPGTDAGSDSTDGEKRGISRFLNLEKVSIPFPALPSKRLVFVGTPFAAAVIGYLANFFFLQQPMNEILNSNASLKGVTVTAHYKYWVVPGVVVIDLGKMGPGQNPIQVQAAFQEYAKTLKGEGKKVELRFRDKPVEN